MITFKNVATILLVIILFTSCKSKHTSHEAIESNASSQGMGHHGALTADQALDKLIAGNKDFVKKVAEHSFTPANLYDYNNQIKESRKDQHPIAFILSCMDSRVPPEIILEQGIGEIFVDRVAGNLEDQYILGSMEYAVTAKEVKLIVVMGHKNCGAIHAAFEKVDSTNENLVPLIAHMREGILQNDPEPYEHSAQHNVALTIQHILKNSKVIRSKVEKKEVEITGALYDISTGEVDWNWKDW